MRVATDICTVVSFFLKMRSFASFSKLEEKRVLFSFLDCFVRGKMNRIKSGLSGLFLSVAYTSNLSIEFDYNFDQDTQQILLRTAS